MSSIDERIVEMKFNNGQFQKGVADTTKSLDSLKKGLNLEGAQKGLADISAAGKGMNLEGLGTAVENISSKFTALGMMGVTALVNITNQAVNTGLQMAKSLTIAPIMDGFAEYELKMGSIQTILANTARHGTNLEQVTTALDDLNAYADKTIYNFGDMTKNIGLFTNAGLKVEDATSMIKGFSNEAAASGTTAAGAAGAAYQLSQALSAGTIRLMDWRSLTNVGMGNKNMQNGLVEMADAMGTLTANSTSATEVQADFNGSLEKNWLSADVMSNYLKIMAGDMTSAEQAALGLSDAQIKAFAKQAQTAEDAATKVRTWTQLYDTLQEAVGSSWAETFDIIIGDFDEATDLFTNVSETLGTMIGSMGDARNAVLTEWDELGGRQVIIDALANAFNALMDIVKAVGSAFGEVFPPMTGQMLYDMTENFKEFTASLKMGSGDLENLKSTFKGLFAIVNIVWQVIKGVASVFGKLFGIVAGGTGSVLQITGSIGDFLVAINDAIMSGEGFTKFFEVLGTVISAPLKGLIAVIGIIGDFVAMIMGVNTGAVEGVTSALTGGFEPMVSLGEWLKSVWEGTLDIFQKVGQALKPLGDLIANVFGEIGTLMGEVMTGADFSDVLNLINTGLLGGIVLLVKKFFDNIGGIFNSGKGVFDSLSGIFDTLTGSLEAMQNNIRAKTLITIAGAVALLTVSVVALSLINPGDLTKSLTAITVMFTQLMGVMAVFTKIASGKGMVGLPLVATGLILISIAVAILAGAVSKMADLSWEGLVKGLTGVIVLLGALVGVMQLMPSNPAKMIGVGLGLVVLAAGIRVLAEAVQELSGLSWAELTKGLVGVGALLGGLSLFTNMAKVNKGAVGQAVGLLLLATALKIMASAVGDFAAIPFPSMVKGLAGIAGGLLILAGAMNIMPAGMVVKAAGLVVVGFALKMIAEAVASFGSMSWEEIGRGLVVLAGSLLVIAGALAVMSGTLAGAAALIVVAAALNILVPALQGLGSMSWEEIGKGLVMLAGSLLILAGGMALMSTAIAGAAALLVISAALSILVPLLKILGGMSWAEIGTGLGALALSLGVLAAAGMLLTPALPGLLGLGAALLLVGLGVAAAGIGIAALAMGLTALATAGAVGTGALVAMGAALIGLIPQLLEAVGQGIVLLAGVIATSGPVLIEALTTILLSMIQSIINVVPQAIEAFVVVLMGLLEAVATVAPTLVEVIFNLIMLLVDQLVINVPKFVEAGIALIAGVIQGIANQIGAIITAATNLIVNFLNGISNNLPKVIDAGIKLIISFVQGLADGIRNNTAAMQAAGTDLAMAIIDGITGGLASGIGRVIQSAKDIAGGALNAAKDFLGIESPSKRFFEIGAWSAEGQANGMDKNAYMVEDSARNVGDAALTAMRDAFSQIVSTLESDMDFNPVITPVLDISGIEKSAASIGDLFSETSLPVSSSYRKASSISDDMDVQREFDAIVSSNQGVNLTFNQNNTSPESLSDIEIYRKTNNLLSQAKEALEKV